MKRAEAVQALEQANAAISTAAMIFAQVEPTLERFVMEEARMASVGPILDPTLFNSSERRATEALLSPLYRAALDYSRLYKSQLAAAAIALGKVRS